MVDCEPHRGSKIVDLNDALYRRSFDGLLLRCLSHEEAQQALQKVLTNTTQNIGGIVLAGCWIGFALYLLTRGCKKERSTGVEAKRRGRESVIDPKNHCRYDSAPASYYQKMRFLHLSASKGWEWGSLRNSRRMGVGSKSSPTCCGAFGREVRGEIGFDRVKLSLL